MLSDAYIDHPSFGSTLIARLLEAEGYRVAVLAQPDWHDYTAFSEMGKPRFGVFIGGGNLDSMVAHYTVAKRRRDKDLYSPGGEGGQLCALDNGGILPVGASQKGLPRLQKGGRFIAEIARGLGAPGICQAHRDPPARIPLLRPITHRGGKQMAAAALIMHRLRHQGAPATAIQQPRCQG